MNLGSGYPFWLVRYGLPFDYPALKTDINTDVLIMGGGISGALVSYYLTDAGVSVTIASPKGGQPPIDPKSEKPDAQTKSTIRYFKDDILIKVMSNTLKLSDVNSADYDAVFYPGGHGPLWDLAEDTLSIALIENMLAADKPVVAVCHAPGVLHHVKSVSGRPVVQDKKVTGFTNTEEEAAGLTDVVPFLVEDMLKKNGGNYSKVGDWQPYVVIDGLLITGQNPASSGPAARALLEKLA